MNHEANSNHRQNTLYEGRKGYVVHCDCCNTFHIAYGTVSFDQTESSLLTLMNVLDFHYQQYENKVHHDCRCIQIVTPFKGFRLLFSINEIESFKEMLSQAYLVFEAERIVNNQ